MDSGDIILIAVLAISAISSIIGKAVKNRNTQHPPTPPVIDNPWHGLDVEIEEIRRGAHMSQPQDIPNTPYDYESEPFNYDTESISSMYRDNILQDTVNDDVEEVHQADAMGDADYSERDADDIMSRFNIRDAVIYSEILKPKFQQ
jgi:hypothetical protein